MKRLISLLLLVLATSQVAVAQVDVVDLQQKAANAKTDTGRLRAITDLFWEYSFSQPKKADSLAQVEMALAQKIRSTYWVSMAWNDKAILAIRRSDFATAIDFLNRSLEIRKRLNDAGLLASTYSKLGNAYAQLNQNEKALTYLFQALAYYEKLGLKNESGIVLSAIGIAFTNLKDPQKALIYLQRAAGLHKATGDAYSYQTVLANVANVYLELKKPEKAIPLLQNCALFFEKVNDEGSLANVLGSLGLCFRQAGNLENGLSYYLKAYRLAHKLGDSLSLVVYGHNIGSVYVDQHKRDSATKYLAEAENISHALHFTEQAKMVAYSRLKLVLNGNAAGQKLLTNFRDLTDSLARQQNAAFSQEMDVKYGTELRESKIRNLTTENELKKLEITQKEERLHNTQLLVALLVALALALIFLAFFYFSRLKIRNQLELNKVQASEQKKALTAVLEAQEKERSAIAAELHDSIGQQLGALKFHLEDDSKAAQLLAKSTEELRQISHRMMPVTLTHFGLVAALEELFLQTLKPAGIAYTFDHFNLPEKMPETLALPLYRVAQELVSNLLRHSGAAEVHILLRVASERLLFQVEDNGKGLGENSKPDGIGLQNIRTRLQQIGGELILENRPQGGLMQVVRVLID